MTRQRKWQLKQKAAGNCTKCGQKAVDGELCKKCREWFRTYSREWQRKFREKAHGVERIVGIIQSMQGYTTDPRKVDDPTYNIGWEDALRELTEKINKEFYD